MRDDFAIFILTHGRANNVVTLKALKASNYTGRYYLVIDNEDKQADEYYRLYGKDKVIMFDKLKKSTEFDTCDVPDAKRNAIVYARNACFDIAKDLGLTYFMELDDDYTEFRSRIERDGILSSIYVLELDKILEYMIEFLDTSGALSVAMSQIGDFIGGMGSKVFKERLTRKCMNSFICRTDRPFTFIGRINEDVNTYVYRASIGQLMFTIADVSLNQLCTQQNKGGMTTFYLDGGTYLKSFYSIITNPSSVKISTMGVTHIRFHHLVNWDNCAPKIISSKFKKN